MQKNKDVSETLSKSSAKAGTTTNKVCQAKKKAFIYVGPNIKGGRLNTGDIFNCIPDSFNDIITQIPEVKKLFVEVSDLCECKKDLEIAGSEYNRLYQIVKKMNRS